MSIKIEAESLDATETNAIFNKLNLYCKTELQGNVNDYSQKCQGQCCPFLFLGHAAHIAAINTFFFSYHRTISFIV